MVKKRLGIGFLGGGFISRFHIQSLLGVRAVSYTHLRAHETLR